MPSSTNSILFVDDSHDILLLRRLNFEHYGYTVYTAATAESALLEFKKYNPRVVVLDVIFKNDPAGAPNGFEICKQIHALDSSTILMIVTGMPDIEYNHVRGLECGASKVLSKPVMDDELNQQIQLAIARKGSAKMKAPATTDLYLKAVVIFVLAGLSMWCISNRISDARWQGQVEGTLKSDQQHTQQLLKIMKDDVDMNWAYSLLLRDVMKESGLKPPPLPKRPNYSEELEK